MEPVWNPHIRSNKIITISDLELYGPVWNMYETQLESLTWKRMEPVWNPYKKKIVWNPTKISDLEVYGTCMEPLSIR